MRKSSDYQEIAQKLELPKFADLTLRQLYWLHELAEHGLPSEICRHYEGISRSMLSRDLKGLSDVLKIEEIYSVDHGNAELSEAAKRLNRAFSPLFTLLSKYSDEGMADKRVIRCGSGGSLLAWLIGHRISELREHFSGNIGAIESNSNQFGFSFKPMRNREVIAGLKAEVLDFGLIRESLLASLSPKVRSSIVATNLGEVCYGYLIPERIIEKYGLQAHVGNLLPIEIEEEILEKEFFATVWPEGEFKMRLEWALREKGLEPKIEFSYRSFPQILPHLIEGTHVGVGPYLPSLGVSGYGVRCYFTRVIRLSSYKRTISLVTRNDEEPWFDREGLVDILRFGKVEEF